jgi:hypothetical protein
VHFRQLALPEMGFAPDELISRKELAAVLQVPVDNIRSWEKRGLMPPRAPAPVEGVLTGLPRVLWRGSDLQEWRERMIGVLFQKPPQPRRGMRWIAGTGWVDPPPRSLPPSPVDDPTPAQGSRRSSKIPGRHLTLLTRLEGQLATLPPDDEPEPVEQPQPPPPRPKEPEPIPFASNVVQPRARPASYW